MRPALFFLGIAAMLAATPASAQSGGTPANVLSLSDLPYTNVPGFSRPVHACFDGRRIVGANRVAGGILYLQTQRGPIWRMQLAERCEALNEAERITMRASGGRDVICAKASAELIVQTASGAKRCKIQEAAQLDRQDISLLSAAQRR